MKYDEIQNKNLFKSWLGISELVIGENVELKFNDVECYQCIREMYFTDEDDELSEGADDMSLTITHKTFENVINEYDMAYDLKDELIVL